MGKRFEVQVGRTVEFGKDRQTWEVPTTDGRARKGTGTPPPEIMRNNSNDAVAACLAGMAIIILILFFIGMLAAAMDDHHRRYGSMKKDASPHSALVCFAPKSSPPTGLPLNWSE